MEKFETPVLSEKIKEPNVDLHDAFNITVERCTELLGLVTKNVASGLVRGDKKLQILQETLNECKNVNEVSFISYIMAVGFSKM